jgi:hypothetical protein
MKTSISHIKENEVARYDDLFMDFSGKSIFIRYNPDKLKDKYGKSKNPYFESRMEVLENVINNLILLPTKKGIQLSPESQDPILYGFDYYGIKQDEKIINTDIRKVGVIIKKAYSTNELLQRIQVYYRIYVKEGQTEVDVQEWTKVNRSYNQYYFMFDTRDKIPNEYYIDLKVYSDGAADTYKKQIKFQIVNRK